MWITLLVGVLGAVAGIGGSLVTAWDGRRRERDRKVDETAQQAQKALEADADRYFEVRRTILLDILSRFRSLTLMGMRQRDLDMTKIRADLSAVSRSLSDLEVYAKHEVWSEGYDIYMAFEDWLDGPKPPGRMYFDGTKLTQQFSRLVKRDLRIPD